MPFVKNDKKDAFEMTALLEVSKYQMKRKEEFSPALLQQVLP